MPKRSRTSYFTKRGQYFGNLWAVYSCKADEVLLLSTDRQLAHWLLFLEFSPYVKTFSFKSGVIELDQNPGLILNYHVEVVPVEGNNELHYLQAEGCTECFSEKVIAASHYRYKYREFNDNDWTPRRDHVLPLLKLASFLAGSRNLYIPAALREKAINYILRTRSGTLRSFLSALPEFERNLVLVTFARLFLERVTSVDFELGFFSQDTRWRSNEH
ncbi:MULTISPECIES: hypothetical protein [unclassified Pseudomonas]|uniref:hypothetical protein n=1 Tax=unclassified Pseudomonas TaxID=196821 RepID=UPI000CD2E26D|nr:MULTISPECIES: hypothetical protein [unclassified Pseudomonas]POA28516.1 hypothetical protein C1887_23330 [Pseudomonas sp. GW456-R21]POA71554.1 hypothetical protein C1884_00130 [Pseudomonas sp. GW460-R15]